MTIIRSDGSGETKAKEGKERPRGSVYSEAKKFKLKKRKRGKVTKGKSQENTTALGAREKRLSTFYNGG